MTRWIVRILNDAVLGFFALVSLFLLVVPSIFTLSPIASNTLLLSQYTIICLFALEYGASWTLAGDKRRFALDWWRIVDLLIVTSALVAFLPVFPDLFKNSPILRLFRLGQLALLGTRSRWGLREISSLPDAPVQGVPAELAVVALATSGESFEPISWEDCLDRIKQTEPDWLFINGVTEDRLVPIAAALAVPEKAVQGLFQSSVPRFGRLERFSTLFVRYPLMPTSNGLLRRTAVLLVGTAENVVVLSRDENDLVRRVEARLGSLDVTTPRMVRAMVALVSEILRAYAEVVEGIEGSLLQIETEGPGLQDERFLARTFELRADILQVRSSLKYLTSVANDLARGQISVATTDPGDWDAFRLLAEDARDLCETIEDSRESLRSLVDLRLNVSSFQMNRVMRLLALLTALALIPATAGGLLGMNLTDTPWPASLTQVSFGVAAGMALSLYVFAIKGWLR